MRYGQYFNLEIWGGFSSYCSCRYSSDEDVLLTVLGGNECYEFKDFVCNPFQWCCCIDPTAKKQSSDDGTFQEVTDSSKK